MSGYQSAAGAVPGVSRGCGHRIAGGVYLESGVALPGEGKPLEYFLVDPPRPYTVDHRIGVELVEIDGVTHVVDYVGAAHYPEAVDFLEEVRAYGLSRRIPKNLDVGRLGPLSTVIIVHGRGRVENLGDVVPDLVTSSGKPLRIADDVAIADLESEDTIPTSGFCRAWRFAGVSEHMDDTKRPCSRHLWMFVEPDAGTEAFPVRTVGTLTYPVVPVQEPVREAAEFGAAIVAAFPITRFTVIEAADGSHADTVAALLERSSAGTPPVGVQAS